MLVLSRKEGERLVIGDNVVITVNRISGNRITLGIEAPRDVRIVRGELEPKSDAAPSRTGRQVAPAERDTSDSASASSMQFIDIDAAQLERMVG